MERMRKIGATLAMVVAASGGAMLAAPAAGATAGAPPAGLVEMTSTSTFSPIGYGGATSFGKTAHAGAVVNSGLAKGRYIVNLVWGSTSDIAHPHHRQVCTLDVDGTGRGWCDGNVHARIDAPAVNAVAVTLTKPHTSINDPVAVAMIRFG